MYTAYYLLLTICVALYNLKTQENETEEMHCGKLSIFSNRTISYPIFPQYLYEFQLHH